MISLAVLLNGCVATRVEPLVDPPYPARAPESQITLLSTEPVAPHIIVARITVGSANASREVLRQRILDLARSLGADAVVEEKMTVVNSWANPPFYERSLFGPMGAGFGLYGYGWYSPYSSNPFLLTQGASDLPRIDRYMSGLAIRNTQNENSERSP